MHYIRPTCSCAGALTYLQSWLGAYKTGNISETVENKAKVATAYMKSYISFRLPPKCMTLNDLCA